MRLIEKVILVFGMVGILTACGQDKSREVFVNENLEFASSQIGLHLEAIQKTGKILNARTIHEDGSTRYIGMHDWTSGFFPGIMWYMYEHTNDRKWKDYGIQLTESISDIQYLTWHHDVGFMIGCSFGNAYRLTGNKTYEKVIVQAAKSLSTRFKPGAGITQSWNTTNGWMSKRGWECPVIIDNMMNLELFFDATRISGDSTFYDIAVQHANTTMKNHFREDFSSWHVVDYDTITGAVRQKNTAQGYSDESAWARGQAWGLYGYTVCYRETKNPEYLELAENIANFIFMHPNLPEDLIPYWDYNAPNIPNELRDASAAAITASALYELSAYSDKKEEYLEKADKIMESLASPVYRAKPGENNLFLLKHSVGSIPHGAEIDVPLNYADYYFLEALKRMKELDI
ncbi:MAG: glycoside hydrolase family 88 protein [Marinilabiliaceae bacterium]|nr:glycoside hydrolase family 88 protein [Marinilabiliaceae bacterium]